MRLRRAERTIGFPPTIQASFQGTAAAFQDSRSNMLVLIITALGTVYIVLGMLYESYIHPITILSTIPSAGVGALLALLLTHNELNVIGMIGIILLIGLVKKNAIMMIDVALDVERTQGKKPVEAIYDACILRFRPIMMTTMAALLGGLPLGFGKRNWFRIAPPVGNHDCRRADREPDADAVHDAGGLCVSRPLEIGLAGRSGERAAGAFIPWRCHPESGALSLASGLTRSADIDRSFIVKQQADAEEPRGAT